MSRIATILARSGSKGFPHKNIREFLGEPLLTRTIRQARRCGAFDCVTVSSDSDDYLSLAKDAGADVLIKRPPELSGDAITKIPGSRHAVEICEKKLGTRFDVIVDLAVTSPLRADQDIIGAINLLESTGAPLVLSGNEARDNPYFNMLERNQNGTFQLSKTLPARVTYRQASPKVYALNGAVYLWTRDELFRPDDSVVRGNMELYIMPDHRSIDIDDEFDLQIAQQIASLFNASEMRAEQ